MKSQFHQVAGIAVLALAAGCASPGPSSPASPAPALAASAGSAVPLKVVNAGFEDEGSPDRACPPKWWCVVHSDPSAFRFTANAGGPTGRFLRGESVKGEPWAIVTQTIPAKGLEGRVLRVSTDVSTAAMRAGDGAGAIARIYAPGGRVIAADKSLRKLGQGWGRATVEVAVPKGAELIDVGVVMYGSGIADFDNVAAEHLAK